MNFLSVLIYLINISTVLILPSKNDINKGSALANELFEKGKLEQSLAISKKNLRDSRMIAYSDGIAEASLTIARILDSREEFKESDHYLKIVENENHDSKRYTYEINTIWGDRYFKTGLFEKAKELYERNLEAEPGRACAAYDNIANCFDRLKLPDSTFLYQRKALHLLKESKTENKRLLSVINTNIGICYIKKHKLDSARFYLSKGLHLAEEINEPFVLAAAKKGFGSLALATSQADSAIVYFQQAFFVFKEQKDIVQIKDLCLALSSAFELKNDHKMYVYYLKQYLHISDSLGKKNNLNFVVQSMMQKQTEEFSGQSKTKAIISWIGVIGFGISLFYYLRFNKYKNRQKNLMLEKEQLIRSISKVKAQIDGEFLNTLVRLAKRGDPTFFLKFNELHPDFRKKLYQRSPGLSLQDLEFCSYMKMNFSTKEIARYTNVSVRAAETRKYRIRKKLKLLPSENINLTMMNL